MLEFPYWQHSRELKYFLLCKQCLYCFISTPKQRAWLGYKIWTQDSWARILVGLLFNYMTLIMFLYTLGFSFLFYKIRLIMACLLYGRPED